MPGKSPTIAERSVPPGFACPEPDGLGAVAAVEVVATISVEPAVGFTLAGAGVDAAGACGLVPAHADSNRLPPPSATRRSTVRRLTEEPPEANDTGWYICRILLTCF